MLWASDGKCKRLKVAGQMVAGLLWRLVPSSAWCLGWSDSRQEPQQVCLHKTFLCGPASLQHGKRKVIGLIYGGGSAIKIWAFWPGFSHPSSQITQFWGGHPPQMVRAGVTIWCESHCSKGGAWCVVIAVGNDRLPVIQKPVFAFKQRSKYRHLKLINDSPYFIGQGNQKPTQIWGE